MTSPQTAPDAATPIAAAETRNGVFAALGAYVLWGFLPILFGLLSNVGSVMIVAERTLWSLLLLAVILGVMGKLGEVLTLLTDWRKSGVLLLSAALLACNWLLFVWAVETGQVLEVSFGYFINPLVNVAIGMVMLGERQNRMQAIAILIAVIAIAIQAAGLGGVPFIALGLALSFGFYGFFRKTAALGPAAGLFAETLLIAPFALAYVAYDLAHHGIGVHADPQTMLLLVFSGPATAVPLLLFAYAIRRLRLTTIGMFQYLAPSLQFLVAIIVFHEHLNGVRLASFALIWVSLAVFSYDSFRRRARG
ncbi:EamA family transporter RarD [Devosia neptuniae]|uniref:EamA family transporter RarD n=1 Tax=Devosia neptuniae TaxID=191302 RepID=A0ABY6C918_9HYPH|nr:EamA family transporter RarD [Devosia neptuniae]UXN68724.1 EamA family transporter RarD [Devosia neptuniae]